QRSDAVGEDVGAGVPLHQARRRYHPLRGVEGPQRLVRIPPRVELHRAERHAARPQVTDGGFERAGNVATRFGLVPVRGAVVGPVRGTPVHVVGVTAGPQRGVSVQQLAAPSVERETGRGRAPYREFGREPFGDRVEVAVPAAAQTVFDRHHL